ncbi:MAG: UbiX family flavin prenyltransferase [Thermoproteota archaeon]|jgi:4-hydroxy-3-polyprenylbenzoate decarboxylase|nr:UbiX family flavin prenyltransferase [Thermoproteota archaeon]
MKKRIIVGISGASGSIYGYRTLVKLRELGHESHLVVSSSAWKVIEDELDMKREEIIKLANFYYEEFDFSAPIASGSFPSDGMIIAPCSMKTVASIANGLATNLLLRAADVCIKEKRTLVLLIRETPLSFIHLDNLRKLSLLPNVVIFPPLPAWYSKPKDLIDLVDQSIARALRYLGIEDKTLRIWKGEVLKD